MEYSVQIALTLYNDVTDIYELASVFPIAPDHVAVRGTRRANPAIPRQSYVSFRSEAHSWAADIEEHWQYFATIAQQNGPLFVTLAVDSKIDITIIVDHKGRFPALNLPKDFVLFASTIGASIDIDVYEENMDML